MNDKLELNAKVPIIICILIILFIFSGIPFILMKQAFFPPVKNTSQNISTITIYETIIVTVTPTPDGKLYFANEYESGIRKIKRPFSWYREDVSGQKDLSVHVTVYNYKSLNSFTWFNPSDYKYYKEYPSNSDNKFMFVFIQIYMDDEIGNDPRMWLPNENRFVLQANNRIFYPVQNFTKQVRIKEFEETYTLNDDSRIGYYGGIKQYQKGHRETAGEIFEEATYLKGGKSNAVDGYIIYEVPKDISDNEFIVNGAFNKFGNAAWILEPEFGDFDYYKP